MSTMIDNGEQQWNFEQKICRNHLLLTPPPLFDFWHSRSYPCIPNLVRMYILPIIIHTVTHAALFNLNAQSCFMYRDPWKEYNKLQIIRTLLDFKGTHADRWYTSILVRLPTLHPHCTQKQEESSNCCTSTRLLVCLPGYLHFSLLQLEGYYSSTTTDM